MASFWLVCVCVGAVRQVDQQCTNRVFENGIPASPPSWVVFFSREIGWNFKTPTGLSIYLSKKRAPCLSAYPSFSPKNGRLTFFAPPPHAFVGFLKDEKWHVGPGFTPVSGKSSRGNGPQMASSGIFLAFPSAYLSISAENERLAPQPIYLSLEISSAFKVPALSPEKKRNPGLRFLPHLAACGSLLVARPTCLPASLFLGCVFSPDCLPASAMFSPLL